MITIVGATGNTGGAAAGILLDAGEKVRVLGRSRERLQPLAARGADALEGEITDAAFLTRAFTGSDAVYTLIPPDYSVPDYRAHQHRVGEAIADGIRGSGVRNVVFLSSIGAQHAAGTGPIAGLHAQEKRLAAVPGLNALFLRAAYFFENFFPSLAMIKHQGIHGSAFRGDLELPMTAAADVGRVAAEALRKLDFTGPTVRWALGAADLSMNEATRIIGEGIGRPDLHYVQFPYEAAQEGMLAMGIPPDLASLYVEMSRGVNEGLVVSTEARNTTNTTPTRFEEFTRAALAPAYRAI